MENEDWSADPLKRGLKCTYRVVEAANEKSFSGLQLGNSDSSKSPSSTVPLHLPVVKLATGGVKCSLHRSTVFCLDVKPV